MQLSLRTCLQHLGASLPQLVVARLHRNLPAHREKLGFAGIHREPPAGLMGYVFTDQLGEKRVMKSINKNQKKKQKFLTWLDSILQRGRSSVAHSLLYLVVHCSLSSSLQYSSTDSRHTDSLSWGSRVS